MLAYLRPKTVQIRSSLPRLEPTHGWWRKARANTASLFAPSSEDHDSMSGASLHSLRVSGAIPTFLRVRRRDSARPRTNSLQVNSSDRDPAPKVHTPSARFPRASELTG